MSKMDLSADPRQDFRRYAAGKWLDKATIPGDLGNLNGIGLMKKQVGRQVASLLVDAAAASPNAKKGTPLQQVGDFYAAGMDVERLKALGVTPLQPEWERIAKIDDSKALAEEMARLSLLHQPPCLPRRLRDAGYQGPDHVCRVGDRPGSHAARAGRLPGGRPGSGADGVCSDGHGLPRAGRRAGGAGEGSRSQGAGYRDAHRRKEADGGADAGFQRRLSDPTLRRDQGGARQPGPRCVFQGARAADRRRPAWSPRSTR